MLAIALESKSIHQTAVNAHKPRSNSTDFLLRRVPAPSGHPRSRMRRDRAKTPPKIGGAYDGRAVCHWGFRSYQQATNCNFTHSYFSLLFRCYLKYRGARHQVEPPLKRRICKSAVVSCDQLVWHQYRRQAKRKDCQTDASAHRGLRQGVPRVRLGKRCATVATR